MLTDQRPPQRQNGGRPSMFSEEMAERIIEAISGTNKSIRQICDEEGMPSTRTLRRWRRLHPEFDADVKAAHEGRIEDLLMECVGIADEAYAGVVATVKDHEGNEQKRLIREDLGYLDRRLQQRHALAARLSGVAAPTINGLAVSLNVPALPRPEDDPLIEAVRDWGTRALPPVLK